ncbi:hypothetical protein C8256_00610 [Kluyvera genomosp. 2]|uniref:Uncharacterized protein n=1 Tax=Kluyvera genomosp. 2 TaxID=2774054 RepID=A0A2T2Y7M4_9ENTR|nr:hypothetical protein C8256_00610 [Kluyvera genomosp. 2]
MPRFYRLWQIKSVKYDTAHENETGYSLVLASATRNPHHVTETGFCFCGVRGGNRSKMARRD